MSVTVDDIGAAHVQQSAPNLLRLGPVMRFPMMRGADAGHVVRCIGTTTGEGIDMMNLRVWAAFRIEERAV